MCVFRNQENNFSASIIGSVQFLKNNFLGLERAGLLSRYTEMRSVILIVLTLLTHRTWAQNGYVKLDNDSTLVGYLKYYHSIKDGSWGIEFWQTKNDKAPRKISRDVIDEYAIKKDTFKVLHQFKPFTATQTFFEVVDAKLKSSGKVNLYIIEDYSNANRVSTYTGGGLIPALIDESLGNHTYMYILEVEKIEFLRALPSKKEKLMEALMDFFPERYVLKYAEVNGEIKYKDVPDLVKLYNSK